jgi:hypothetical protein
MGRIAERVQPPRHRRERDGARIPDDERLGARQVQSRLDDAGQEARQSLHEPDAGAAVDAFQVELGAEETVGGDATGARSKAGVVQLGIGAPAGPGGRARTAGRRAQRVVAFQPVPVDDGVDRSTTTRTA